MLPLQPNSSRRMAAAAAGLAVATDDGTIGKLKNNRYVPESKFFA